MAARRWAGPMVVALVAVAATGAVSPQPGAPAAALVVDGRYVALGDSYTSAPLVPTQLGDPGGCLRSDQNHPHLLAQRLGLELADASCSGARTTHAAAPQDVDPGPNPPQLDRLTSDTQLVTVGLGINDIGFRDVVQDCFALALNPFAPNCRAQYEEGGGDEIADRIDATGPNLGAVLDAVHARSPAAAVFVVGYPAMFPTTGPGCSPSVPLRPTDLDYLRGVLLHLNATLEAVAEAHGATYVDTYGPSLGHDMCTPAGVRWVEPLIPASPAFPVHPNALGQVGVADIVQDAIAAAPDPPPPPPTLPGAPTGLAATATDGGASLTWAPPGSDGGSPVTRYVVYRDDVEVYETADATTLAHTDAGLANGTTYEYRVAAVNAAGEGPKGAAVTVTPTAPVVEPTFADVPATHPFYDDVQWVASQGISTGYPGVPKPTYRPAEPVTRQAMSAFMYRLAGSPAFTLPATPTFTDVGPNHPFASEIEWMATTGVTTGFLGGTFRPGALVTRQAMSAFMYRLAGSPTFVPPGSPNFGDVATTHPFFKEIEWMAAEGVSTGFNPGPTYRPGDLVTRQAMAAFLRRLAGGA